MPTSKIEEIKLMIDSAEASLRNARKLLLEVSGESFPAAVRSSRPVSSFPYQSTEQVSKVVEGVFTGEQVVAPDGEIFPVPANYASKSKLVAGDHMKLSILHDGRFIYKQIGPVPRTTLMGVLVNGDGQQYRVMANGKAYRVLLASVTYYKVSVGDNVTIIIPQDDSSEWAAIEAVLPKDVKQLNVVEDEPEQEEAVDF